MTIEFENGCGKLCFEVSEGKIFLREIDSFGRTYAFVQGDLAHSFIYLLGGAYVGKNFTRYGRFGEELFYLSHGVSESVGRKELRIVEGNDRLEVRTVYTLYEGCATVECRKEIENLTGERILLECASPLTLSGILDERADAVKAKKLSAYQEEASLEGSAKSGYTLPYFWKAYNSWTAEAAFERLDLRAEGLRACGTIKRCGKICVSGNGTQTTNRYLPMGLFEKENKGWFAFELLPAGSWSYELEAGARGFDDGELYLAVTGKTYCDNGWYRAVGPRETYVTDSVRFVGGADLDTIARELTGIRRKTFKNTRKNVAAQVVYNNFMQNTYGWSNEKDDEICIPAAKEYGADYYVIDAGWHDYGENGRSPTHELGEWRENTTTYPSGVLKTAEKARANGMKFGLWVELQSVGYYCKNKELLPEKCFFHVDGVRPQCNFRYQLDYSQPETREWADGVIARLVKSYAPEYIKIDYNQTHTGNDCPYGSQAEGVAAHCRAYDAWFDEIQRKYPQVLFESCASGGMRNDSRTASGASLISISDQSEYDNYPRILSGIFLSLLPEQSGIWNMPIQKEKYPVTTDEEVVMNCVNSLYGVMHLASKLYGLGESGKALLKEGIAYYRRLGEVKERMVPVFPQGLAKFDDETYVVALKADGVVYASVYNVSDEEREIKADLTSYGVRAAELVYPKAFPVEYTLENGVLSCKLKGKTARAFEFR